MTFVIGAKGFLTSVLIILSICFWIKSIVEFDNEEWMLTALTVTVICTIFIPAMYLGAWLG